MYSTLNCLKYMGGADFTRTALNILLPFSRDPAIPYSRTL